MSSWSNVTRHNMRAHGKAVLGEHVLFVSLHFRFPLHIFVKIGPILLNVRAGRTIIVGISNQRFQLSCIESNSFSRISTAADGLDAWTHGCLATLNAKNVTSVLSSMTLTSKS